MNKLTPIFLIPLMMLSGCVFPLRIVTSPAVKGTVVDERTGMPVGGVEVFVSNAYSQPPTNPVTGRIKPGYYAKEDLVMPSVEEAFLHARPPFVLTASDGSFSIPAEKKWILYIVPMDIFFQDDTLVVRHERYNTKLEQIARPETVRKPVDLNHVNFQSKGEQR